MSTFASSEPAVAAAQQQQQQGTTQWQAGYVPTSQVMASLAARNQGGLQQQQQQQQQQGMGRGRGTTFVPGNPPFQNGPQPQVAPSMDFSLPPLEFVESQGLYEHQPQTIEGEAVLPMAQEDCLVLTSFSPTQKTEIQRYLPDLFDGDDFQGLKASLIEVCCHEYFSPIILSRLCGNLPFAGLFVAGVFQLFSFVYADATIENRGLFLKEILPEVPDLLCNIHGCKIIQDLVDKGLLLSLSLLLYPRCITPSLRLLPFSLFSCSGTMKQGQMIFAQLEEHFVRVATNIYGSQSSDFC